MNSIINMIDLIKWFWNSINFREWTFEGCELANPFRIIWRLIWFIPVFIGLTIFSILCGIYDLDFASYKDTWERNT